MQVRRFTAPDMAQATRLVRQALGPEAVILATNRLPDGRVEIQAAVEPAGAPDRPADDTPPAEAAGNQDEAPSPRAVSALARRVEELGRKLSAHLVMSEAAQKFAARPEMAPLYDHLSRQEVAPEIVAELMEGLGSSDGRGILPRLSIRLKKLLAVWETPPRRSGGPSVWALVGPTGVGKTTTAAKLAATFALRHRLRVGMITVDTYRMAAAEQLKVYGRIMEVPTLVAADGAELKLALDELGECDLVLVDTVGRSPGDEDNLAELERILSAVPEMACHLLLACPTRQADQQRVVEAFARFKPASLIFTKLDETMTFGPILNQVVATGLPVSYLTVGQKVPDDLERATREGLARRLMPPRR